MRKPWRLCAGMEFAVCAVAWVASAQVSGSAVYAEHYPHCYGVNGNADTPVARLQKVKSATAADIEEAIGGRDGRVREKGQRQDAGLSGTVD